VSILQAFILGLFQGVAEFLPISSSGHLLMLKHLMGLGDVPVLFDVILHVATLGSILVVFRRRIAGIVVSTGRFIGRRHGQADAENLAIIPPAILATILTAVIGLLLSQLDFGDKPRVAAGLLLVTAVLLVASTFLKGTTGYSGLKLRHGLMIGIAQGIGVLPGISRSGITISAGLASGLQRETAGEFAFLLAVPAIGGALVLELKDIGELAGSVAPAPLIVGSLAAFVAGVAALLLLLPLVRRGKLAWFAAYLIPVGILGMILL
jgi:undecaprenyl-diphosphatase